MEKGSETEIPYLGSLLGRIYTVIKLTSPRKSSLWVQEYLLLLTTWPLAWIDIEKQE